MSVYATIPMSQHARMHSLIWALIYGGLLTLIVAYFTSPQDPGLAIGMSFVGGIAVVAGIVLLFYRSTIKDKK
jgi:hypothetical protein